MSYTVVALAADPLARAELGAFLDGLELLVLAELAPDDLMPENLGGFLDESTFDALVWEVDGTDTLLGTLPDVPLLALVSNPEDAAHALRQGASGVLSRDTEGERLLTALEALTRGLAVLEPAFLSIPQPDPDLGADHEPLTPRERDVLGLLAEGMSNKAIAKRLRISDHTVKFHLNAVLSKLGATSRTEAVTKAVRAGLLTL